MLLRNYTRWRQGLTGLLHADILGGKFAIDADPDAGHVLLADVPLSPDEARMIGVRLIEGAALADGDRAIRRAAELTDVS